MTFFYYSNDFLSQPENMSMVIYVSESLVKSSGNLKADAFFRYSSLPAIVLTSAVEVFVFFIFSGAEGEGRGKQTDGAGLLIVVFLLS